MYLRQPQISCWQSQDAFKEASFTFEAEVSYSLNQRQMRVIEAIYLPQVPIFNSSPLSIESVNFIHACMKIGSSAGKI